MIDHKKIICILGPTASGKSDLSIQLARAMPAEIISVDSALIYRDMDIGTAKPDATLRAEIPHHLIDIRDAADHYSVATFVTDALAAIKSVQAKKRTAILVGGTMLYFKALLSGLSDVPPVNLAIRDSIQLEAKKMGWPALHARLTQVDPALAANISINDKQRIGRGLEVYQTTGKPLSTFWNTASASILPQDAVVFAVTPKDRKQLHFNIEQRFKTMLEAGFLDEVSQLYDRADLSADLPAIRSVGYRQAWQYLSGECDYNTFVEKAIVATRRLAKRQLTWLRHWPMPIKNFDTVESNRLTPIVLDWLRSL